MKQRGKRIGAILLAAMLGVGTTGLANEPWIVVGVALSDDGYELVYERNDVRVYSQETIYMGLPRTLEALFAKTIRQNAEAIDKLHNEAKENEFLYYARRWENGKTGFVNLDFETVIPLQYDAAKDFSEGLAAVCMEDKWGYIDLQGETVLPYVYERAEQFSDGVAAVYENRKYGYIDKKGTVIVPAIYDQALAFSEGIAPVRIDSKWGYIDKSGKQITDCIYESAEPVSNGRALVAKDGKYGYINPTGKEIIPCSYSYAKAFSEGVAAVGKDGKWGYINQDGKEVIPFIYELAGSFHEGLAWAQQENCGYINQKGEIVIPFSYQSAGDLSEGYASIQKGDRWGLIDRVGQEIIPCMYEGIHEVHGGLFKWSPSLDEMGTGYSDIRFMKDASMAIMGLGNQLTNHIEDFRIVGEKEDLDPTMIKVRLDGEKIRFDQKPVLQDGRTMVPLRAIAESFAVHVEWDGETGTVLLTS